MYLKTLEVRGFKSFASKTTFEFEPGITAVVGPNGSGKSNVVDALAWVMGEQGAKNLRGGKMEDVIFAGTSGRQPLGRAQVKLTIDNSDGQLPIEYSEVTISRTLFRSGGSEYEINGAPARLLDIQELLSDSGMGREMHVIVGQGQLDRILQATPEERRGFIEEASGVLKHRRRKERSVRKLDAMRVNLDRIRDLTEEVRRQLGPLSRQANTAKKAQSIQFDVRDAKTRLLADDIFQQQGKIREAQSDTSDIEGQKTQLLEVLHREESDLKQSQAQLEKTSQAASSAREHRHSLVTISERIRSLDALARERLNSLKSSPPRAPELTVKQAEELSAQATNDAKNAVSELQVLRAELEEAQQHTQNSERQSRVAADTYTQLLQAEADRRQAVIRAESRVQASTAKLESIKAQNKQSAERIQGLTQELEQTQQKIEEVSQELAAAQAAVEDAEVQFRQAQDALHAQRDEENELRRAVSDANTRVSGLRSRAQTLKETIKPPAGSPEAQLKDFTPQNLATLIAAEPGWEKAISVALESEFLGLFIGQEVQLEDIAERITEAGNVRLFSSQNQPGHSAPELAVGISAESVVSFKTSNPAVQGVLRHLLGTVRLVEDLAEAQNHRAELKLCPENRFITRQGHEISYGWTDLQGQGKHDLLRNQAALEQAQKELAQAETQSQEIQSRYDNFSSVLKTITEDLDRKRQHRSATQNRLGVLNERHSALTAEAERIAKSLAELNAQQGSSEDTLAQAQTQQQQAQEQLESAQAAQELGESEESADGAVQLKDQAELEAIMARKQETEVRLKLRTAESMVQQVEKAAEQARRRLSATEIAHQEFHRQSQRYTTSVDRLEEFSVATAKVLSAITSSVHRAENDHDSLQQEAQDISVHVAEQQRVLGTVRKQLEEINEKIHLRNLAHQEHEIKLEQLRQRALDEFGYTETYLLENFGPDVLIQLHGEGEHEDEVLEEIPFDRAEQQDRLNKAERRLRTLGKINPLALEEYTAVQQRHQYLSEQLADLEESRQDLLNIIADVDATVLKVFKSAFEDTAAEFEHVFATLFPGGEGRLSLTEPDNLLETGIEVEARPAGKKVKRLSLLSGGERSLAAVAMLVSIFKARPSPFYVMDEVEAALDDTNLSRLLTIFRQLQEDSQLIIITHQKRTMEIADALYGVSMRGDGVSRVLSQPLESSESPLQATSE